MSLKLKKRPGQDCWYVRGTVRGIRVYETTSTAVRKQAEAYRAKREAQLYEEAIHGKSAVVSFQRAALSYLNFEPRSAATDAYVARLTAHFGTTILAKIDQSAADKAVTALVGDDAAPATKIRTVYGPLGAILNYGHARKWCPLVKFDRPQPARGKTRWLTPAEALALIDGASPHLKPLLHFILCTGARLSEALDLDWADVDLPAAKVVFRDTKNGDDRAAALPPAAIIALAKIDGEEQEDGTFIKQGQVFRRDDGEPYVDRERLEGGQIRTSFGTALRRAGITAKTTPHDLRHTWATWFYALTKDLLLLKHEGGWKSAAMVERYAHLMPSSMVPEIAGVWGSSHPRIGALPVARPQQEEARTA